MPTTTKGTWTPADNDDWDLTIDLAAMANSIDLWTTGRYEKSGASVAALGTGDYVGQLGYVTSPAPGLSYSWTGTAWVPSGRFSSGPSAQRSAFTSAPNGLVWLDTDGEGVLWIRSSGSWVPKNPMSIYALSSAVLASNSWTVLSSSGSWSAQGSAMAWSGGVVIPRDGIYEISFGMGIAVNISVFAALKKNNTSASLTGVVAMSTSTGFATETAASVSRKISLVAGDVITPAAYTTGTAGPYGITSGSTFFSVAHLRGA